MGCVHLCRLKGNTVWSHINIAISYRTFSLYINYEFFSKPSNFSYLINHWYCSMLIPATTINNSRHNEHLHSCRRNCANNIHGSGLHFTICKQNESQKVPVICSTKYSYGDNNISASSGISHRLEFSANDTAESLVCIWHLLNLSSLICITLKAVKDNFSISVWITHYRNIHAIRQICS